MKIFIFVLLAVSGFASLCLVAPAPNYTLLPLTVGLPELAPWLLIFNLAATALAAAFYRPAAPAFAVCLLICAWPLAMILGVARAVKREFPARGQPFSFLDSLRGVPTGDLRPETLPLNIRYFRPTAPGPRPAIVDIYGGAWQRGSPDDNAAFHRYMAMRGYAVFAIDYRHAPEAQFPAQLDDVRAALAFIRANAAQYGVDAAKLALCGRSSGGQLALLAAYQDASVRAVISLYGPTNLLEGYADLPSPDPIHVRTVLETYLGGPPATFRDRYEKASPVNYVRAGLPPTLQIQGGRDHIVKPIFASKLHQKLLAAENTSHRIEIPWAEHAFDAVFSGPGSQLALHAIDRFLEDAFAAN